MAKKSATICALRSDEAIYDDLPRLSGGAAKFILALLTFRRLGGECGPILMDDIVKDYEDIPAVLDELAERGVAFKEDNLWCWHPALFGMMAPGPPQCQQETSRDTNVIPFPSAS